MPPPPPSSPPSEREREETRAGACKGRPGPNIDVYWPGRLNAPALLDPGAAAASKAGWVTCRSNKCRSPVAALLCSTSPRPPHCCPTGYIFGGEVGGRNGRGRAETGVPNSYNGVRNTFSGKVCSQNCEFLSEDRIFWQIFDAVPLFMMKRVAGWRSLGRAVHGKAEKAQNAHI